MKKSLLFFLSLFMLALSPVVYAQQHTVNGTVFDSAQRSLPGATVIVKGTTKGSITDSDGKFTIHDLSPDAVLMITFMGMKTQEVAVKNQTSIQVYMEEDAIGLEEMVVVGYGTMKKSDLTGSVATIATDDLKGLTLTNADEILKGRLAGVQVTQSSGAPGGASSIRIRGASSINSSNEPLYVIDGIPFTGDGPEIGGFSWSGGANGQNKVNPLATIAPSDIVSMDVLKDASATAIYGAAGANGVIIINTRRGQVGAVKITYDGYYAVQTVAKTLDMMDLRQYAQYQIDMGEFLQTEVNEAFLDPSILGEGTDWQDAIFRSAPMQSHQLSLTGGSQKARFAASGGYMSQDGIIFGSGFERYNMRVNADGELGEIVKMGGSLAFTHTDEVITRQDGTDGVIMQALTMSPAVPVYNFDGSWAGPDEVYGASVYNPLWLAKMQHNNLARNRSMGNMYLSIDPISGLTVRSEFGFDISENHNKSFIPTYDFGTLKSSQNKMYQRDDNSLYWIWKNYATYNRKFNDALDLTAMAGAEVSKSAWEGNWLIKQDFSTDDILVMTKDGTYVSNDGWKDEATTSSVFGRLNLNYKDRYLLTGTMRADASSKFGPDNKWGYFPSAAFAWRASNEAFLKDSETISNLKLRLGYGVVGNSNIETYLYGSTMQTMATPMGTAYRLSNVSNPNLKWESSEQYNLGIDFGMFANRINLTLDVYQKDSKDLLMQVSIPSYLGDQSSYDGIAAPWVNIGKTRNRGVDISLNTVNIDKSDFEWASNLVVSINRNKVLEMNDDSQVNYGNLDWWSEFQTATAIMVGQPMGVYYGYKVDRLFTDEADVLSAPLNDALVEDPNAPGVNRFNKKAGAYVGDIKFQNLNDDNVIDANDQTVIGDPNPDFTFGFTNTFSYKNIDLAIGLNGSYGGDLLNFSRFRTEAMVSIWDNQAESVVDRAQVGINEQGAPYLMNPDATVPRPATNDFNRNTRMSDRWIEDGSYLRISNITLGYSLTPKTSKYVGLSSAKVYLSVENLYTFTSYSGYDPEIGAFNQNSLYQGIDMGRYPSPRKFTIGLNLGF